MALRYWIILIFLGTLFGGSFALNEVLLDNYGPLTISMLRVTLGAVGCWIWVIVTGRAVMSAKGVLLGLFVFGIFQYSAPFALLPLAQARITSSMAGLANAMTPVAVVIVSQMWSGGERVNGNKITGIGFGFAGMMVLTTYGAELGGSDPHFVVLAMAAPISYAIALNMIRRFKGIDLIVVTTWAMTGSTFVMFPAAISVEGIPAVPDLSDGIAIAVLGFGLTSAAFLAMFTLLPHVGATNLSLVTFVAPVSATLIGAQIFGDVISGVHLTGMFLIMIGLFAIDGRIVNYFRDQITPVGMGRIKNQQA